MTIISEIRKRPWIMLAMIGLALLAFILDPTTINNFSLGGKDKIGKIAGVDIRNSDYERLKSLAIASVGNGPNITENYIATIAWDELLSQIIVDRQWGKLGIPDNEVNFWQLAAQQYGFITKGGAADVEGFKKELAKWQKGNQEGDPESKNNWNSWLERKDFITKSLRREKYIKLVAAGLLTTDNQLNEIIKLETDSAAVEYTSINYNEVYQKENIKISDGEIEAYIQENKDKYEREEGRTIDFVLFKSQPTPQDVKNTEKKINSFLVNHIEKDPSTGQILDTVPAFSNSTNDSAMVATYSDRPVRWDYFNATEIQQGFSKEVADFALSAPIGSVSPVYRTVLPDGQDAFVLAKLNDKKSIIDSSLLSHILISYIGSPVAGELSNISRTEPQAKKIADSIYSVVKANPAKFSQMITLTDDVNFLASPTGQLPWLTRQATGVPELAQFALNNSPGSVGLVKTQMGYHIVVVNTVKSKEGYRIATITKFINPSESTETSNYNNVNSFYESVAGKGRNVFSKQANAKGYAFNSVENATLYEQNIVGLGTDKDDDVLKWAFNKKTKIGDIKQFSTSDDSYIVAYLAGKSEKGLASVKSVKEEVTEILKKKKATEYVNKKIKGKGLSIIGADFSTSVSQASAGYNVSTDPLLNSEPKVLGAIKGLKVGATSQAIQGNSSIFIVKKLSVNKTNPPSNFEKDQLKQTLYGQSIQSTMQNLLSSLIKYFKPKDERTRLLKYNLD